MRVTVSMMVSDALYASEGSGVDRQWDDLRAGLDGLQVEDGRPR